MRKNKYSLFPVVHKGIWDLYEVQTRAFWVPFEIDFSHDLADLDKMSPNERALLLQVLAFFAQSDGIVNENLCLRFMSDINIPEVRQFYSIQVGIEAVHAHTYNLMIDTYIKDLEEKNQLFNAIGNFPAIAGKARWATRWIDSQEDFAARLLAFALVEGVFFSGSFCTIYWLRDRGILPGLAHANDLIARDEGLHWLFASVLYKELVTIQNKISELDRQQSVLLSTDNYEQVSSTELGDLLKEKHYLSSLTAEKFKPLGREVVESMVRDAVRLEQEFMTESLPVSVLGMNTDLMGQYIEFQADVVLSEFGFTPIFGHKRQPFDFMIKNDVRGKVNFFERRASEYVKSTREKIDFAVEEDDF